MISVQHLGVSLTSCKTKALRLREAWAFRLLMYLLMELSFHEDTPERNTRDTVHSPDTSSRIDIAVTCSVDANYRPDYALGILFRRDYET